MQKLLYPRQPAGQGILEVVVGGVGGGVVNPTLLNSQMYGMCRLHGKLVHSPAGLPVDMPMHVPCSLPRDEEYMTLKGLYKGVRVGRGSCVLCGDVMS